MDIYEVALSVHVTCVVITGSFFAIRGIWMLTESPLLSHRWVKVLPHVIDTVLLLSAIALAVVTAQYPLVHTWLTVKVVLLVVYVLLGVGALRGKSRKVRMGCFLAAMATFGYIVTVAYYHHPLGLFWGIP